MRSNSGPAQQRPPLGALPPRQESQVRRNRKLLRAFWWSLPVLAMAILLGSAALFLQWSAWCASEKLQLGDWEEAAMAYRQQAGWTATWPAPWVANYNLGTALLQGGDISGGRAQLEKSWQAVPRATPDADGLLQTFTYECQVRINLAVSWEMEGDQQRGAGDTVAAVDSYDQALEWAKLCQIASPEEDEEGSSTAERIQEKRESAQRELSGEPEPEPAPDDENADATDDPFAGETPDERDRREQLEQRNREQQELERERSESQNRGTTTPGW